MESEASKNNSEIKIYTFPGTLVEKIEPYFKDKNLFTLEELEQLGEKDESLRPITIHETENFSDKNGYKKLQELSAALKQTSRIGTYNQYVEELREEDVERILENSLGKGHNAAADLITERISLIAPRIFTLWLTTFERGVSLLQKSTRRIEHNAYFIPKEFSKNERIMKEYSSIIAVINEDYNKLLECFDEEERKKYREDAMYIQPLSLLTSLTADISLRAFWQMFLESGITSNSKGEKIINDRGGLDAIFEYSSKIFDVLQKNKLLVRKWNTNYDQLQHFPSGSLFLPENGATEKLEEILLRAYGAHTETPIRNVIRNAVVLEISDPLHVIENYGTEKIIETLKSKENKLKKNMYDVLKTINVKVLRVVDLSLLHQETRHRTVPKQYEPLVCAAKRAAAKIAVNKNLDSAKLFTYPEALKGKAEIFAKDYEMLLNFWNKLINEYNTDPMSANIVLPHGLKVFVYENFDGYNLIKLSGERLCATAKKEMQYLTQELVNKISEIPRYGKEISELMKQKCFYLQKCSDQVKDCPKKAF